MGQIIMKRQKGNEGEEYIDAFPKLKNGLMNVYVVMKKDTILLCLIKLL